MKFEHLIEINVPTNLLLKGKYLFCHKALAKVFRAKLLAGIRLAGLTLPASYPTKWVVDCQAVGTGHTALVYLGRYLYRGVAGKAYSVQRKWSGYVSLPEWAD